MSRLSYARSSSRNREDDVMIEEGMRLVSLLPDSPNHATAVTGDDTPTHTTGVRHTARANGAVGGDYYSFTVVRLRQELKKRGLSQQGIKRELVARLLESDTVMAGGKVRGRKKADSADLNGDAKKSKSPPGGLTPHQRMSLQKDRMSVVLWCRPLLTLYYFFLESLVLIKEFFVKLWLYKKSVVFCLLTFLLVLTVYHTDGAHQKFVSIFREQFLWCAYWVGLGILSSVGLGTGLHTFLLYLGPHIAAVTLAAFECMSVDFPAPPYPNDIICPEVEGSSMSLWTIMSKVRLEAFMWGAGTAIGELPPYFMARASRLSGQIDEEEQEIEELIQEKQKHVKLSFLDRGKIVVHDMVQRVGFVGILLCASIPNPLFDLAGITCGHFLVPFWTFFGATLIGKAVIKMHIQKLFVIFVFSEKHVEHVVHLIKYLPYGKSLQAPFKDYLQKQKQKLHHTPGTKIPTQASWLSWIFEKLVMVMVAYFIVSIINSMAQNYHKRCTKDNKPQKVSKE